MEEQDQSLNISPLEDKQPVEIKPTDSVITIIEGRLLKEGDQTAVIEILPGLIVEVTGPGMKKVQVAEEKETARSFIRIEVTEDELVRLEVTPKIYKDVIKGGGIPFAFALGKGLAVGSAAHSPTVQDATPGEPKVGVAIPGESEVGEGGEFFISLTGPNGAVSTADRTCQRFTVSMWGATCDSGWIAEIGPSY